MSDRTTDLIEKWRKDPNGTHQTWFLWEERRKNFRSIRRGVQQVVKEIEAGVFGNLLPAEVAVTPEVQTHEHENADQPTAIRVLRSVTRNFQAIIAVARELLKKKCT